MRAQEALDFIKSNTLDEVKRQAQLAEGMIEELKVDGQRQAEAGDLEGLADTLDKKKEYEVMYRIFRGYYDVLYFSYEYFSDDRNPENKTNLIPSGSDLSTAPTFHSELCLKLDGLTTETPTKKIGWGAPRGSGKSAYLSNIYPTHAVVYGTRKYILIISETVGMSQNFLEFISTNLKFNDKLRADFGVLLETNKKMNETDNQEAFVTKSEIKVQASSMGGQLRGSRFKNARPDLIICDDLESSKNTNTQELREKNLHWFNSVIEPIGDPTKTAIIYMGTLVHGQGLLPNVVQRPEYDSRIYSSVIEDPEHPDYWEKFDTMLRDVEDPERLTKAENFYYEHKAVMDEGVRVLWPERFSYLDLMKKKVDLGTRAFASEYLNIPSDLESAIFKEEYFNYFDREILYNKDGSKKNLELYGFWDIALGKNSRSDYNAIVIIGKEPRTGVIYVLEAWGKKCPPHEAQRKALDLIAQYRPKVFGVETINAQFEFYRQLQTMAVQESLYFTRIKPVNPTAKKEQRIEALEPLFEQGLIRIQKHHRLLEEMLIQYPQHNHDDLPDALASCLNLTRLTRTKAYNVKPQGV